MSYLKQTILPSLIVLASLLPAATLNVSDQFYNAIRADNGQAVAQLIGSSGAVNTRDSRGDTPLMYAAAVGSAGMMQQLLAAGADVNAKDKFESTAIMWCSNDLRKVRLLIDKGADVNAHSKQGRTPLQIAAMHDGNVEVIRLLLKKGVDVKAPDSGGSAALIAAAAANDTGIVKLLLELGADVKAKDAGGFTALIEAAGNGNAEVVKLLLARGADVNAQSAPSREHPVKNGPIAIGSLTPLLLAVTSGSAETVRLLLDAGANVNARDVRQMTPLMLAIATDRPHEGIIRMLLAKGASTDPKSNANETALHWAAKFQHPSILPVVRKASPEIELANLKPVAAPHADRGVREAVAKSVTLLQKTNVAFLREGGCISCHAQNITSQAVAAARLNGIPVDEVAELEVVRGTRLQFTAIAPGMLERLDPPAVEILTYSLFGVSAGRVEPDRVTDALVHNIAAQQQANGSWGRRGIMRPPTMDSGFSPTAFAIRSLRDYAPPARKGEMDERIARAAKWLMNAEPLTTEDSVMQLLGVKWAGVTGPDIDRLSNRVLRLQREDGGWAQTPHLKSDAYATATAMVALKQAPVSAIADAAYKKGVAHLLSTQAEDGSWFVASRAPKFQPYFEGGFPYGHDQWISQWATGYAAIALSYAIPDTRAAK